MAPMISLEEVRWRLAKVWFGGSAVLFLILVGQSLGGLFGAGIDKVWAWAIPNIAPTLSLMISVFAAYALLPEAAEDRYLARGAFFKLAYYLSIFYIFNVFIVIVAAPFSVAPSGSIATHPIDVLHLSNLFLGPLQGLTAAALAVLFFTRTEDDPRRPAAPPVRQTKAPRAQSSATADRTEPSATSTQEANR